MSQLKYAVVLANLGAPSDVSEVPPFLKNLFNDPDIFHFPFGKIGQNVFSSLISFFRSPWSRKYYEAIGGGSPLHANTIAQANKLSNVLKSEGDFSVFVGQRYWHPFFSEVTAQIRDGNFDSVVILSLYPHYSTTTTLSIINEWRRYSNGLPEAKFIDRFYQEPGYIQACVEQIQNKLKDFEHAPHILFSAHSVPVKRIQDGDPYEKEIIDNVELIMDQLGRNYSYSLCYQSKVGPVKWLEPSVETAIDELVRKDINHVLVFPISFVSEHLETLYELDIQKRKYALNNGVKQYERANTVQDSDTFIAVLKKLVLEAIK